MDALLHLAQAVRAAPRDGGLAKGQPFIQDLAQAFLCGFAIQPHHGQVDGGRTLQTGVRQERQAQLFLRNAAAFGFKHQAHGGVFAGFVAHGVEQAQHLCFELRLFGAQGFFAGFDLGIGQFFDFLLYLLCRGAGRQFRHHQLPLPTGEFFYLPARPHLERAAPAAVGLGNLGTAADDLPAAGVIGAGDDGKQLFIIQFGVFHQGDAGIGHFAQIVRRDFSRQTHGNAAGAIEQGKGQARGQLRGFFGRAVVIGDEIHRAHIDFIGQQGGDFGQARFRIAHGGSAVAVTAAKIALAVYQRVTQAEVLRHAHQGFVSRSIAMGVKTPQHIAHHTGGFNRLGAAGGIAAAKTQTHAQHAVENAALHGLLPIGHIGQGAAFDHGQGVFQIGALGVGGQRRLGLVRRCGGDQV